MRRCVSKWGKLLNCLVLVVAGGQLGLIVSLTRVLFQKLPLELFLVKIKLCLSGRQLYLGRLLHCLLEVCSFGILSEQLRAGFLIPSSQVGDCGFEIWLQGQELFALDFTFFKFLSKLWVPAKQLLLCLVFCRNLLLHLLAKGGVFIQNLAFKLLLLLDQLCNLRFLPFNRLLRCV